MRPGQHQGVDAARQSGPSSKFVRVAALSFGVYTFVAVITG